MMVSPIMFREQQLIDQLYHKILDSAHVVSTIADIAERHNKLCDDLDKELPQLKSQVADQQDLYISLLESVGKLHKRIDALQASLQPIVDKYYKASRKK